MDATHGNEWDMGRSRMEWVDCMRAIETQGVPIASDAVHGSEWDRGEGGVLDASMQFMGFEIETPGVAGASDAERGNG